MLNVFQRVFNRGFLIVLAALVLQGCGGGSETQISTRAVPHTTQALNFVPYGQYGGICTAANNYCGFGNTGFAYDCAGFGGYFGHSSQRTTCQMELGRLLWNPACLNSPGCSLNLTERFPSAPSRNTGVAILPNDELVFEGRGVYCRKATFRFSFVGSMYHCDDEIEIGLDGARRRNGVVAYNGTLPAGLVASNGTAEIVFLGDRVRRRFMSGGILHIGINSEFSNMWVSNQSNTPFIYLIR